MIMRNLWFVAMPCLLLIFQGCGLLQGGPEAVEVVWPETEGRNEGREEMIGFDDLKPDAEVEANTIYLEPHRARQCPQVKVMIEGEESVSIQPAREDCVTLVVFWTMGLVKARAAARHARDLLWEFRERGLRVIGILPRQRGGAAQDEQKRGGKSENGCAQLFPH